jgi:hypothetical protein
MKKTRESGETPPSAAPSALRIEPPLSPETQAAGEPAFHMTQIFDRINDGPGFVDGRAMGSNGTHPLFDSFIGCRRLDACITGIQSGRTLPSAQMPTEVRYTTNASAQMKMSAPVASKTTTQYAAQSYFSPRDLAKRWSVCVDKVLTFIRTGELRAFDVASSTSSRPRYRISAEEVHRFEQQTRSVALPHAACNKTARRRKSSEQQQRRTYF